jgi:nucleotide-binding universal stress UspA family protein
MSNDSEKMRIIVAYDGSACSEAAIDDLSRAGLPADGEALAITVADVWLPVDGEPSEPSDVPSEYVRDLIEKQYEKNRAVLRQSETLARAAADRLRHVLPGWKIESKGVLGSPAWEILDRAQEANADLIVVGSHGHTAIGRFFLGSISQKVLSEAACSVRVARGRVEVDPGPVRILIGYDGSAGSDAAIEEVGRRQWPEGSEVRVVSALETISPLVPGFAASMTDIEAQIDNDEKTAGAHFPGLESAALAVTHEVLEGHPKNVLVEVAESWHADCIFVGANRYGSRLERFLLGSTAAAVAARAHCSVEAVRRRS